MKKNLKVDWFARLLAIASLIVAIISIIIPYQKTISDDKESIIIFHDIEENGDLLISSETSRFGIPWIITLSNVGKVDLSIISYDIEEIREDGIITAYLPIDNDLTDLKNTRAKLPLSLKAGETKLFRLYVAFDPPEKIKDILLSLSGGKNSISFEDALFEIGKEGYSLYRKEDIPLSYSYDTPHTSIHDNSKHKLKITTGRNQKFYSLLL